MTDEQALEELGRLGWTVPDGPDEDGMWPTHPGPDLKAPSPRQLLAKVRLAHSRALPDHPALRISPGTVTAVPQQRAR